MTIWMPDLNSSSGPKYLAIADAIGRAIDNGELAAETRLPTHRALAEKLQVTIGTITRSYAEAEKRGLVYGRVGSGTYTRPLSAEKSLLQIPEKPDREIIDLNFNLPVMDQRAEKLSHAMQQLAQDPQQVNNLLGYQPDIGMKSHRKTFLKWTELIGINTSVDNLAITSGGQHGILVSLLSATQAGDAVVAEGLTYPGLMALMRQLNLHCYALEMDQQGVTPQSLENACQQYKPKVFYCTPTLQNPTTGTMSIQRREQLLDICQKYQVLVIEDDVNGLLTEQRNLPMASLRPQQAIYIGSISKVLAPGLRIGFLIMPDHLKSRISTSLRASCWMVSPLLSALVCQWIDDGSALQMLKTQRIEITARQLLVNQIFEGLNYRMQQGGFHIWLNLPEPWQAGELVQQAAKKGVLLKAAETFTVGRFATPHAVRISISSPQTQQQLAQGLKVIKQILQQEPENFFKTV